MDSVLHSQYFLSSVYRAQQRFPHKWIKNTFYPEHFKISQTCVLSGAKKFSSVTLGQLESLGNLSLFEITRALVFFPENFSCNLKFYESENFSDSSLHRIFDS